MRDGSPPLPVNRVSQKKTLKVKDIERLENTSIIALPIGGDGGSMGGTCAPTYGGPCCGNLG